jgi:hypothetical protein
VIPTVAGEWEQDTIADIRALEEFSEIDVDTLMAEAETRALEEFSEIDVNTLGAVYTQF